MSKRPCPFQPSHSPHYKQYAGSFQCDPAFKNKVFDRTLTLLKEGSRRDSFGGSVPNKENDEEACKSFTFGTSPVPSPPSNCSNLRRWFPLLSLPRSPFINPPINRSSDCRSPPSVVTCRRCCGVARPLTPCGVCDCDLCPSCTRNCEKCASPVCSLCSALCYENRYDSLQCKQCAVNKSLTNH